MVVKKVVEFFKSILFVILGLVIVGGGWYGYSWWQKGGLGEWQKKILSSQESVKIQELTLETKERNPSKTELGEVYKGESFEIKIPKDWRVDKSGKVGEGVYFFGPMIKSSTLEYETNIGVRSAILDEDNSNYIDEYLKKMSESLVGWTVLNRENLDEGVLIEASFVAGRDLFRSMLLIRMEENKVWIINALSLKSSYEEVKSVLRDSLLSLVTW